MTKLRLMNRLRREDWYAPLLRTLEELEITDFAFLPPRRSGHPILRITIDGLSYRMPVPCSGSGGSAIYVPANIKKLWRAHHALKPPTHPLRFKAAEAQI